MWLCTSPNTLHWKYFFLLLNDLDTLSEHQMMRNAEVYSWILSPTPSNRSVRIPLSWLLFFVLNRIWKEEPMNSSTLFFLKLVLSILVLSLCHMNFRIQLANFSRKGSWNVVGVGLAHTSAGGVSLSSNAKPSPLQAFLHIVSYSLFILVVFCCLHSTAQRQDTCLG